MQKNTVKKINHILNKTDQNNENKKFIRKIGQKKII